MTHVPTTWIEVDWIELKAMSGTWDYLGKQGTDMWHPFVVSGLNTFYTDLIQDYKTEIGSDEKDFFDNVKPALDAGSQPTF